MATKENENVLEGSAVNSDRGVSYGARAQSHSVSSQPANDTSLGLSSNVGAGLVWLWWILALIFAIVEKKDRNVRTQAVQSLLYMAFFYVLNIVVSIGYVFVAVVMVGLDSGTSAGAEMGTAFGIIFMLSMICLGAFMLLFAIVIPVIAIIMGFSGKPFKLPVLYGWAEKLVARWA